VPDQLRRSRPARERTRRTLRPARHLRSDLLCHSCEHCFLRRHRTDRAMAATGNLTAGTPARPLLSAVTLLRIALIVATVVIWEAVSASGLLFRDVVPSLVKIGAQLVSILTHPDFQLSVDAFGSTFDLFIPEFYRHLGVTVGEVATA